MTLLTTILASIFVFGLMILFHELGHFIMAKRTGITVTEFAMGFGPKLISRQYKGTEYSLRIFPLGGFVKLLGEDAEEVEDQGSFQNHPVKNRFAVIAAGPLMNFILAVILFSLIYFLFLGVPSIPVQIGMVVEGSRAEEAGLLVGDSILTIDEEPMSSWEEIVAMINANPETLLEIIIDRDGEVKAFYIAPEKETESGRGFLGIGPMYFKYRFFPSLKLGIENTWTFLNFIFFSIIQMLTGKIPAEIAGPVGIIQIVGE
ncbi:MAG TPA: RIP metalloprotease RseP, partial [Firmicutes bacterium]|nr:RIP metalloprotease RseP [Bacillota bacterium]